MQKKQILTLLSSVTLIATGILLNTNFSSVNKVNAAETSAPQDGGTLTKTIVLNDTSDAEIRNYYSSLNSLSEDERKGTNLLKNLKPILQNMYYFSYSEVWKIYEITDREWELSPASETTYGIYNESTNTITNYEYGSNSNPKNDPYVKALYRNRDENGITISSGRITNYQDHTTSQNCTNREHIWPNSRGFPGDINSEKGPAFTDIHHLRCSDGYVNKSLHNDHPYGYVNKKSVSNQGTGFITGNYYGAPLNKTVNDADVNVFEPQDSDKGDIARAVFYMAACYNNLSGRDTITDTNPNLAILDNFYTTSSAIQSNATTPVGLGKLSDLLEWHKLDPVDEFEIYRNDLIYNNYQHNRNPFIDFPSWVDVIWGNSSKYAKPSLDSINAHNDESSVEKRLESIEIRGTYSPTIAYKSTFDTSDLSVYAIYNDKSEYKLNSDEYTVISTVDPNSLGKQKYEVLYENCSDFIEVFVSNKDSNVINAPHTVSETTLKSINGKIGDETFVQDGINWLFSYATNANPYKSGSQFGKADSPHKSMSFSTSDLKGTVTSITVRARGAKDIIGTISVTVGGVNFGNSVTLTNVETEYTFTGNASGKISINFAQTSSKAFYVYEIGVNFLSSNFTDKEQANAYATYFLKETEVVCLKGNGDFNSIWPILKSEYSYMREDSISYIKNVYKEIVSDSNVYNMLQRYDLIIKKYNAFDDFIETGAASSRYILNNSNFYDFNILIIVIATISLIGVSIIFICKKKYN